MRPGPPPPDHRRLLRRILRVERENRVIRPPPLRAVEKPELADAILAAVAAAYPPTVPIAIRQVVLSAGCTEAAAAATRRWAKSAGLWIWPAPGLSRPAGKLKSAPPRRRKGAAR